VVGILDSNRKEYEIRLEAEYGEKEVLKRRLD